MKIVKLKKLAKWTGYPLFAIICFMMFLLWTFPFDKVKGKIQDELGKQFNLNVEMESLASSFPFGVQAENVTITSKDGHDNLVFPITMEEIGIYPSIISTLSGNPAFSLSASLFGGEINADIKTNQAEMKYDIKMDISEFDFSQIAYFKNAYKDFPVQGTMDIETDLSLDMKKIKESKGFLEMQIQNGSIGPGKMTFELPKVRTGTLEARFVINNGKFEVEKFTQQSPDMQSDMRGFITLNKKLRYSRVNLDYRFKLSDDLVKKHDVFQLALSAIKNAEGSDKYYYHTITGPITSARALPAKSSQYKFRDKNDKSDNKKSRSAVKKRPAAKKKNTSIRDKRNKASKKKAVKPPSRNTSRKKVERPKRPERNRRPALPDIGRRLNPEAEPPDPPEEFEEVEEVEEVEEIEEDEIEEVEEEENTVEEDETEEDEKAEPEEDEITNEDAAEEQDEPEEN